MAKKHRKHPKETLQQSPNSREISPSDAMAEITTKEAKLLVAAGLLARIKDPSSPESLHPSFRR